MFEKTDENENFFVQFLSFLFSQFGNIDQNKIKDNIPSDSFYHCYEIIIFKKIV